MKDNKDINKRDFEKDVKSKDGLLGPLAAMISKKPEKKKAKPKK